MQTYSVDFFMIAFFTRIARPGYSLSAAGSDQPMARCPPRQWSPPQRPLALFPFLGARAVVEKPEDCKREMLACNNIGVRQQGSMFIPGGLDFLRLSFARNPATLRDRG
jgi:hypothetical protein